MVHNTKHFSHNQCSLIMCRIIFIVTCIKLLSRSFFTCVCIFLFFSKYYILKHLYFFETIIELISKQKLHNRIVIISYFISAEYMYMYRDIVQIHTYQNMYIHISYTYIYDIYVYTYIMIYITLSRVYLI